MSPATQKTALISTLLVTLLAGSVLSLRKVEAERGHEATLEEVLYLHSGQVLKR